MAAIDPSVEETCLTQDNCYVALTHAPLNMQFITDRVRSPQAGAIVLFAGLFIALSLSRLGSWTFLPHLIPLSSLVPPCIYHTHSNLSSHNPNTGTTRDSFDNKPVKELQYSAYAPLALRTMLDICTSLAAEHALKGIAMVHRLGVVPVGEESILIAVSAPHRQAAWRAGEAALEACKARVEVWKREEFEAGEGVWRANRDGVKGERVG
jgi:molybdopterin synthase catalytic subunit